LSSKYSIISPIKCYAGCDGGIEVSGTGGTVPYQALWNDNSNLFNRNDLCSGSYSITVSDTNKCSTNLDVYIPQPNPMKLADAVIVLPSCYQGCDGSIDATIQDGKLPYSYLWGNNQTGEKVNNICAGTYSLSVNDSNNCSFSTSLTLPDQPKLSITGISDYIKLCIGQQKVLYPGNWASYQWLQNGSVISNEPTYTLTTVGTYTINVISERGCTDTKTFTVEYVKNLLHADFLVAGDATVGEMVDIIDVTWPMPDQISWAFNHSDSITLVASDSDRIRIIFNYPGDYRVKLVAGTAQCFDSITQVITVYADSIDKQQGKRPLASQMDIKELDLFPNPNNGTFTTRITLNKTTDVNISIYKVVEGIKVYNQLFTGMDYYEVPITLLNMTSGVYALEVITNNQSGHYLFVIQ
jgi:hypothetical protein